MGLSFGLGLPPAPKKGVGVSLIPFMAGQSDGLWYDFSKTDRLWQNNPPTTPADDAGEVIGLVFDARLGAGPWATNLCTWSQDISNAAWTKTDITVGATTTAPDGTSTAALATAGSAGSDTLTSALGTVVAGSTNTVRIRLKKSGHQWLRLTFTDATGTDGFNQWVDLTNGVLGSSTLRGAGTKISATMTADAFGFYLVTLRGVVSTRTTLNLSVVSASADGSVTRVNGATYYPWGCEIVAGSYSGAYIPTTSIPVTAPGNQAVQATAGFKPTYQAAGGKFDAADDNLLTAYLAQSGANFIVAYVDVPATLAATQVVAGASGAAANRCFLAFNTSGQLCAGVGSDSTATIVGTTDWRSQSVVVGLSFDGSTVKLFAGTAEEYSAAQASTPTTTIPFRIGALNNNGTAGSFSGLAIKDLLVGRQALTLAQFKSIRTQLIAGA